MAKLFKAPSKIIRKTVGKVTRRAFKAGRKWMAD